MGAETPLPSAEDLLTEQAESFSFQNSFDFSSSVQSSTIQYSKAYITVRGRKKTTLLYNMYTNQQFIIIKSSFLNITLDDLNSHSLALRYVVC